MEDNELSKDEIIATLQYGFNWAKDEVAKLSTENKGLKAIFGILALESKRTIEEVMKMKDECVNEAFDIDSKLKKILAKLDEKAKSEKKRK